MRVFKAQGFAKFVRREVFLTVSFAEGFKKPSKAK